MFISRPPEYYPEMMGPFHDNVVTLIPTHPTGAPHSHFMQDPRPSTSFSLDQPFANHQAERPPTSHQSELPSTSHQAHPRWTLDPGALTSFSRDQPTEGQQAEQLPTSYQATLRWTLDPGPSTSFSRDQPSTSHQAELPLTSHQAPLRWTLDSGASSSSSRHQPSPNHQSELSSTSHQDRLRWTLDPEPSTRFSRDQPSPSHQVELPFTSHQAPLRWTQDPIPSMSFSPDMPSTSHQAELLSTSHQAPLSWTQEPGSSRSFSRDRPSTRHQFELPSTSHQAELPSASQGSSLASSWASIPTPAHFSHLPAAMNQTPSSRPCTVRQRPEKKETEGPYYRAYKPWHRQEWQDEPDTPLNRHINRVLVEKLVDHSARNTCAVWSPTWTRARICNWWICVECEDIPLQPVRTNCGHTLCRACAERNRMCQCTEPVLPPLATNCLVMALVEALAPQDEYLRRRLGYTDLKELSPHQTAAEEPTEASEPQPSTSWGITEGASLTPSGFGMSDCPSTSRYEHGDPSYSTSTSTSSSSPSPSPSDFNYGPAHPPRVSSDNFSMALPATWCSDNVVDNFNMQARPNSSETVQFRTARDLVASGRDEEALPYLSGVASYGTEPLATFARDLMLVVIKKRRKHVLVRNLRGVIRQNDARRLVLRGDLDCILCTQVYRSPVTTPCGHTYCRACIERSLDYTNTCPLCSRELVSFNVDAVQDTIFVSQLIQAAELRPDQLENADDRLPIFVCTVAYPMVPCPLFVFEPRYRLMIRRCLRSGSRRFGIVASHPQLGYVDYGTILEIRDSLRLEDGRHIISTIGVSRFRILERGLRDGYDVARVEPLQDTRPVRLSTRFSQLQQNLHIRQKAEAWLRSMDREARAEVETTFGAMPPQDSGVWTPDGPAWLWWVLALLPLDNNLKVMILSNSDVRKRMAVVERTLEIMQLFSAPRPPRSRRQQLPQPQAPSPSAVMRPASLIDARLQRAA